LVLALLVTLGGFPIAASAQYRASRRADSYGSYTVRANTVIRVRMNEELNSETSQVGDKFSVLVTDPVAVGRNTVIPRGSTIYGRVSSVTRAARGGKSGTIGVDFYQLELPNGITRSISGSLISNQDLENVDDEGQLKGASAVKRNTIFIGSGAGAGAIIGAIAGGGKGALIGAAIGAGLGTGGALLTKGQQAKVKEGDNFGVILNRNVALNAYNR
jgi:hypothetical protein